VIFQVAGIRVGLIATEINNVVEELGTVDRSTFARDSILGHTILAGEVTLLLDAVDLIDRLRKTRFKEIIRHIRDMNRRAEAYRQAHTEKPEEQIRESIEMLHKKAGKAVKAESKPAEKPEKESRAESPAEDAGKSGAKEGLYSDRMKKLKEPATDELTEKEPPVKTADLESGNESAEDAKESSGNSDLPNEISGTDESMSTQENGNKSDVDSIMDEGVIKVPEDPGKNKVKGN
jgi:hypothetical protein